MSNSTECFQEIKEDEASKCPLELIGAADESSSRSTMGVTVRSLFSEMGVERKWRLQRQTNFLIVRETRGG